MNASQHERRQHPRVPTAEFPLHLEGDDTTTFRVRDISQSGVAFFSEQPLALMTRVRFTFDLPDVDGNPRPVKGEGAVVRCERLAPSIGHYEVAIFFQELAPGSIEVLQGLIDRLLD
ncbi:MAG: PilZ domain-containing protein [Planctomycetota bacterium]|nr:PilZ domain-containing protein [Planctomycetota bacterium]